MISISQLDSYVQNINGKEHEQVTLRRGHVTREARAAAREETLVPHPPKYGGIAAIVWKVHLDSREPTGRSLDLIARATIRGTVRSLYGNGPLDRTEVYPRDRCSNNRPSVVWSRENLCFHIITSVVKLFSAIVPLFWVSAVLWKALREVNLPLCFVRF